MSIPFIDLKAQYALLEKDIRSAIENVLSHGKYINGPEVAMLEEQLAEFTGVKHVIGCSNGTDALLMALMVGGVGKGDLVFTTPFSFIAAAEMVSLVGAQPVFVDIDEQTFNIDAEKLEIEIDRCITQGVGTPKAIIPVDLFGLPCEYTQIKATAEKYNLLLVEDAAQSLGAEYKGSRTCGLGDIGTTSFFPAKPLGCYGDGGAVFTSNDDMEQSLRSIRVHGMSSDKYTNIRTGLNARLDTLQAAILLVKLAAFSQELEDRQRVADRYSSGLEGLVVTPHIPDGMSSAWAQYSVLSGQRDSVRRALQQQAIPTAVYYPKCLHLQATFDGLGYTSGDFPVAEDISQRIFSLPMHPYLGNDRIDHIVGVISDSLRS